MNQEGVLRTLFVGAQLLDIFVDNFVNYDIDLMGIPEQSADLKSPEHVTKVAARGIIMNCCNAIRLQASSMPRLSFLRQYLDDNVVWNDFIPKLRQSTEFQQNHAMGLKVYYD